MLVGFADVQPLFTVALVLGAMLIGLSWLSRRARSLAGARTSVSLTGQHAVHVIELDGERLLIGTGPSGAPRLLTRLPPHTDPLPEPTPNHWLDRALGALREPNGAPRDRTGGRLVTAPPARGRPAEWPPSKPEMSGASEASEANG